ncbi:SCP2 sterol-binding domain-containing protein [Pseudonocardia alni]|uniref:Alkyl sulfatase BDS1-like metallo-beta-lactamase superfamily hydrolase n=2 Tax=Pseudonocardia alni TaxID=33907 RepID=A0A852WCN0_PSEA5|nr:SCP2 sterol-binding domain-containing protein [Pseudonocardia antarctica]NYG03526.1 alkyl sulfatase BDS1-like metallo-beta-lactamase superfamily hydrolase [Pseudonocardia antarctica]
MPGFADEDELYRYIGGIFEAALADPELEPKLRGTGLVLRQQCTDPDSALIIDLPGAKVWKGSDAGAPEPQATMTMSTETANAYWQGTVNLTFAMAKGKVKVDGTVTKLLQLAPLSKRLFPTYVERLEADGREDLLITT